jgi:hypothetical protein
MGTQVTSKVTAEEKFTAAAKRAQQARFRTDVKRLVDGDRRAVAASVIRRRYDLTETEFKQRLAEAGYVMVGRGRGYRAEIQPLMVTAAVARPVLDAATVAAGAPPCPPAWDAAAVLDEIKLRLEQKADGGQLRWLDLVPTADGYLLHYTVTVERVLKVLL